MNWPTARASKAECSAYGSASTAKLFLITGHILKVADGPILAEPHMQCIDSTTVPCQPPKGREEKIYETTSPGIPVSGHR